MHKACESTKNGGDRNSFSSRAGQESITDFEAESVGKCTAMVKRLDEIEEADTFDEPMITGRVALLNAETNQKEYVYVMSVLSLVFSIINVIFRREGVLCNAETVTSPAAFDHDDVQLVIVDILASEEAEVDRVYPAHNVRLHDVKRVLRIGQAKYVLEV